MRAKLVAHGARIFDTYELLEMLLYNVIPLKDTNPIAKKMLAAAGSLDRLLSLGEDELMSIEGVGERTAKLVHLVGMADSVGEISSSARPRFTFDDYERSGCFFVKHLRENREYMATMLFFDNSMRLLGMKNISGTRFGSAETRAGLFIDTALSSGATIALLGFTHRGTMACPYDSDVATCKMLYDEMIAVGVTLMESFLVSDYEFTTVGPQIKFGSVPSPEVERFCATRIPMLQRFGETFKVDDNLTNDEVKLSSKPSQNLALRYLSDLLEFASSREAAYGLINGSLDTTLSRGYDILASHVGDRAAMLLCLVGALTSRRHTDNLRFGRAATTEELIRYLIYFGYSSPNEGVYVMTFDKAGLPIACDYLGEGTVNVSDVYPRKIIECAIRRRAKSVIIAHNHPGGTATPSDDDIAATSRLYMTLVVSGIRLRGHVIVSERDHFLLAPDEDGGAILSVGHVL